jgi:hypothetical protein
MKWAALVLFVCLSLGRANADDRFWCIDEASGGYCLNNGVCADKSKPISFMRDRTAVRRSGDRFYLNLQGLGEKEYACTRVRTSIIQCVGELKMFAFDEQTNRFRFSDLDAFAEGTNESVFVRMGTCTKVDRN